MTDNGSQTMAKRTLTVKNFSVIKEAKLEFGKITVLIGPQASGKSLLCKLAYFFQKVTIEIAEASIRDDLSLEAFYVAVAREFTFNWFPVFGSESGAEATYVDGQYSVSLKRSASSPILDAPGRPKWAVATFSEAFSSAYSMTLLRRRERKASGKEDLTHYSREIAERLEALQSAESSIYSFIPSTRSFFISPQRALIATNHRLDPITVRFSQDFSFDFQKRVPRTGRDAELTLWIDEESRKALQGEVKNTENDEAVEAKTESFRTSDGRSMPFSYLSAGTQELLPLFTLLREYVAASSAVAKTLDIPKALHKRLFMIEEPEANIFPSTQYDLVRVFARMANEPTLDARWVITTHSPYILSVFGDLIKAGKVGAENAQHRAAVAKVIPEQYWIKPGDFAAYKIDNGKLTSIYDEKTGQIDGDYLDDVSGRISDEFGQLLEIQYGK